MNFNHATFVTGAPSLNECPPENYPEFCFAGRSNVGKSSFINTLTNRNKLARTSNTPGKTQQMNYYLIDNQIYFVDLPGFGFAKVPKNERERWGRDIHNYILKRNSLRLILHLVDSRHDPTALDEEFFYWMGSHHIPFVVLLSKTDKLSKNKLVRSVSGVHNILTKMNIEVPVIPCSIESGTGIDEAKSMISEFSIEQPTN